MRNGIRLLQGKAFGSRPPKNPDFDMLPASSNSVADLTPTHEVLEGSFGALGA